MWGIIRWILASIILAVVTQLEVLPVFRTVDSLLFSWWYETQIASV